MHVLREVSTHGDILWYYPTNVASAEVFLRAVIAHNEYNARTTTRIADLNTALYRGMSEDEVNKEHKH